MKEKGSANSALKKKTSSTEVADSKAKKVKKGKKGLGLVSSTSDVKKSPLKEKTSTTSVDRLLDFKNMGRLNETDSGLFLYIDLHGHTTKRGNETDSFFCHFLIFITMCNLRFLN